MRALDADALLDHAWNWDFENAFSPHRLRCLARLHGAIGEERAEQGRRAAAEEALEARRRRGEAIEAAAAARAGERGHGAA